MGFVMEPRCGGVYIVMGASIRSSHLLLLGVKSHVSETWESHHRDTLASYLHHSGLHPEQETQTMSQPYDERATVRKIIAEEPLSNHSALWDEWKPFLTERIEGDWSAPLEEAQTVRVKDLIQQIIGAKLDNRIVVAAAILRVCGSYKALVQDVQTTEAFIQDLDAPILAADSLDDVVTLVQLALIKNHSDSMLRDLPSVEEMALIIKYFGGGPEDPEEVNLTILKKDTHVAYMDSRLSRWYWDHCKDQPIRDTELKPFARSLTYPVYERDSRKLATALKSSLEAAEALLSINRR